MLGREPRRGPRIDRTAAVARVCALAQANGLDVDPLAIVETLPVGIQQRVELLKELHRDPAVLLLDEPTATLAPAEIAAFFGAIERLAQRGTAILIVTHKLREVIDHTRRVTVMRQGAIVARSLTAQTSVAEIAHAMVGGEVPAIAQRTAQAPRPRLQVEAVRAAGSEAATGISFAAGAGEIVGIAGVEGNGQTLIADALAGVSAYHGTIVLDGATLPPADPRAHLRAGIRTIAQDRQHEGLIAAWSIADNALLGDQRAGAFRRGLSVDAAAVRARGRAILERFDVRAASELTAVGTLSGGNAQKVAVGRALAGEPKLIVAYQPTRGIDVGAAALVHSRLIEARNRGAAIVLISFELDEVLALADRILVMYGGAVAGSFARADADRERIGRLMAGLRDG